MGKQILKSICIYLITLLLFLNIFIIPAYSVDNVLPDSEVVLKIKGKIYKSDRFIKVKQGEKFDIKAILTGGRKKWCQNPEKYGDFGPDIKINSKNKNELVYFDNLKHEKIKWSLIEQKAEFQGPSLLKLKTVSDTKALAEIPDFPFSMLLYITVKIKATWLKTTEMSNGKTTKEETQEASNTFYFNVDFKK